MEQSILVSTKAVLQLNQEETYFDAELLQYINAAIDHLFDLGVGSGDVVVTSSSDLWESLSLPEGRLGMVKQFVFLKTKQLFDPPTTGFHTEATEKQIRELEWRIANRPVVEIPPP